MKSFEANENGEAEEDENGGGEVIKDLSKKDELVQMGNCL